MNDSGRLHLETTLGSGSATQSSSVGFKEKSFPNKLPRTEKVERSFQKETMSWKHLILWRRGN